MIVLRLDFSWLELEDFGCYDHAHHLMDRIGPAGMAVSEKV